MGSESTLKGEPATLMLFAHGKFMRIFAWYCPIFMGGMQALCIMALIFACFSEPDPSLPHAIPLFIFFTLVFIPLVVFSIWNWFETHRRRLAIREDGVFEQRVFGRREIKWKDVVAISWSSWDAITVASPATSIVISTKFVGDERRRWLTEFFRSQFPKTIQHQYRQFRASHLLWRMPRGGPQWIGWCRSTFFFVGFGCANLLMFTGLWTKSGALSLTGFGALGLAVAVFSMWAGWVWRRVVERLGVD